MKLAQEKILGVHSSLLSLITPLFGTINLITPEGIFKVFDNDKGY